MPKARLFISLGLAALISSQAMAQAPAKRPAIANQSLSGQDRALVDQASAYLEGLGQAKGRFVQTDPRGSQTRGDLYMQRPGKMRFAYDPPQGLLVVSDGYNVSVADSRLKTFEKYPLGATPLALLLARHVSLDKGVVIDRVSRSVDGFSITAHDGRKQAEGRIRLVFSTAPLALKSWTVTDAQGQSTRIDISELKSVTGLSASLFQLKDPRILPPTRR
jgi:outer membrane lipoprotein-sorting protein